MRRIVSMLAIVAVAGLLLFASAAIADDHDYMEDTAGGGGWFYVEGDMGTMYKDSFGMYLDANDYSMSSLVFKAREVPAKVQAYEFSQVMIEDNDMDGYWTAHAWGKAWGAGMDWDFHLKVTDMGKGSMDIFWLEVTLVDDPDVKLSWTADGLGGGNIWVYPMM